MKVESQNGTTLIKLPMYLCYNIIVTMFFILNLCKA